MKAPLLFRTGKGAVPPVFGGYIQLHEKLDCFGEADGQHLEYFDEPDNSLPEDYAAWLAQTAGAKLRVVSCVRPQGIDFPADAVVGLDFYPVKPGRGIFWLPGFVWDVLRARWTLRKTERVMPALQTFGNGEYLLPKPYEVTIMRAVWRLVFGAKVWRFAYFVWDMPDGFSDWDVLVGHPELLPR